MRTLIEAEHITGLLVRCLILCGSLALLGAGCVSTNYKITGQVEAVRTDEHGDITPALDRLPDHKSNLFITEGDTFSIRLSSVFVKHAKEVGGSEYLVYAEVFDIQPNDQQRLVRVLFKENNQSPGLVVNQRDRIMFGPIQYNGHPIRIRVFVVELDKEENAIASELIKQAVRVAASFQPAFAPFAGTATSVGDMMLSLNQDDRELVYDFTLYPSTHSEGPYLKTGSMVLFKTENYKRFTTTASGKKMWVPDQSAPATPRQPHASASAQASMDVVTDEYGNRIDTTPEDYAWPVEYELKDGEHPLRMIPFQNNGKTQYLQPLSVNRVMNGQLWIQTVAVEYFADVDKPGQILMSDPRTALKPIISPLPTGFTNQSFKVGGVEHQVLIAPDGTDYTLGERVQYTEKTHAVITISRGGKAHPRSLFEELSASDQKTLDSALQPELSAAVITGKLEPIANNLVKLARTTEVVSQVNNQVVTDVQRASPAFPLAYLAKLVEHPNADERLQNEGILQIMQSMVSGFPYAPRDAGDPARLREMKTLSGVSFSGTNGTFNFVRPKDYEIRSASGVILVTDRTPHEFKVYKSEPQGLVARPASEFFFKLAGSTALAQQNSPSTNGAGSWIEETGRYFSAHAKVPQEADQIEVYLRSDPSKTASFKIELSGFVRFATNATVATATVTNRVTWGTEGPTVVKGGSANLATTLMSTRGLQLTANEQLVHWEIASPNGSGTINRNTYTAPQVERPLKVQLRAVSDYDYSVVSEPITLTIVP